MIWDVVITMTETVTGLGGAFVFSEQPGRLAKWFEACFDLSFEQLGDSGTCYQVFWTLDPEQPKRLVDTTFAIMRARTALPRAEKNQDAGDMYGDQHFMINLRASDLDALVERLEGQDEGEYGLFAWLYDPDGNRVELYEPRHGKQASG